MMYGIRRFELGGIFITVFIKRYNFPVMINGSPASSGRCRDIATLSKPDRHEISSALCFQHDNAPWNARRIIGIVIGQKTRKSLYEEESFSDLNAVHLAGLS